MQAKKKKIKKASSFIFWLLRGPLKIFLRLKYKFRFDKKTSNGIKRPCMILSNHQTFFDQFAMPMGFGFGINFVAGNNIFRHGLGSRLMVALTRPIPFAKGSNDFVAVKHMMSVIKDGGAVGLFPSGNRSFFGEECLIDPSVGKLVKKLGVPVVLVNLKGGYNTKPRWAAKSAKGKMTAGVTRIISPDELEIMSPDEINEIIQNELNFNEFEWNKKAQIKFKGRHKAEYLESVLFWCPECHSFDMLRSAGNDFFCSGCGAQVRIGDTGFFQNISGGDMPETILEWSQRQLSHIKDFDFTAFKDKPVFTEKNIISSLVKSTETEEELGRGSIELYSDRITVCNQNIPIETVRDLSVGISRLNIYTETDTIVITATKNVNLVKYMICAYHLKNMMSNNKEDYYGY